MEWFGGGVTAIVVHGTFDLNGFQISTSLDGFNGGNYTQLASGCDFTTSFPDYYYASGDWRAAPKGQGLADFVAGREWGKGPQANGGGGGNDHNSGGGGGANLSDGGSGGENREPGVFNCDGYDPGNGGKALTGSYARLFFGGGGGSGHKNNPSSSNGGSGGGIMFVRANTLEGNGGGVQSRGWPGLNSSNDGAGGSGGGGTIFLEVKNFGTTPMTIRLEGGDGGDAQNAFNRCYGPGGGSGGVLYYNQSSLPGNVSLNVSPGAPGVTFQSTNACNGSSLGATSGQAGTSVPNVNFVFSTSLFGTPVPVELTHFDVNCINGITLVEWSTAVEINSDYFELQHSTDLSNWTSITRVAAAGNSKSTMQYEYSAKMAPGFIRLKQVDLDGSFELFDIKELPCQTVERDFELFPNPTSDHITIKYDLSPDKDYPFNIFDRQGRILLRGIIKKGQRETEIDLESLPTGFYAIRIESGGTTQVRSLIKQ